MRDLIVRSLSEHRETMERLERELTDAIAEAAELISTSLQSGGKVLVMGNGGSAADAQHFAAEIVGRFLKERPGLPAIALTTDSSILTAIGNDYGFDAVFKRQVEALATSGDVVIGISTSGNSENVRQALVLAREKGCSTIGLLGRDGGSIRELCTIPLIVPSSATPRIQEGHATIVHIVCDLIERRLFPEN